MTAILHPIDATHVRLTLDAHLQDPSEFISCLYFNVEGDPTDLTLGLPPSGWPELDHWSLGADAFPADGGGMYDIKARFNTAASSERFTGSKSLTMVFERAAGLSADDFNLLSAVHGGHGTYVAAIHVQGIDTGSGSVYVGARVAEVPEPAPVVLTGLLLFGLMHRLRKVRES